MKQLDIKADKQVIEDYESIMRGYSSVIENRWEMNGEYFKQFSLYHNTFKTSVNNKL